VARGHPLIVSRVHPTAPIRIRAAQLKRTILEQSGFTDVECLQTLGDRSVIVASKS